MTNLRRLPIQAMLLDWCYYWIYYYYCYSYSFLSSSSLASSTILTLYSNTDIGNNIIIKEIKNKMIKILIFLLIIVFVCCSFCRFLTGRNNHYFKFNFQTISLFIDSIDLIVSYKYISFKHNN